jgi:DUF4097 and DUF4098 domain-containing protein YvlB
MKKVISLLIVLVSCFFITGCGNEEVTEKTPVVNKNSILNSIDKAGSGKLKCSREAFASEGIDVELTNEIEYELEAVNINYYDISFLDNELKIKYKKTKFLGLNRKSSGNILIKLPKSINYNNLNISSTSGDIIIRGNIISNTIKINSVSGDISLDDMSCDNMKVSTVSGDISGLSIEGKNVYVDTISGDMGCNMLNSDNLSISTVSGDINITHANANIKASSISGEIIVNGQDVGVNVKKTIKGFFR